MTTTTTAPSVGTAISRNPKTTVATIGAVAAAVVNILGQIQGALDPKWTPYISAIIGIASVIGVYTVKTPVDVPDVSAQATQAVKDYQDQHYADLVRDVRAAVVLDLPFVQSIASQASAAIKAAAPANADISGSDGGASALGGLVAATLQTVTPGAHAAPEPAPAVPEPAVDTAPNPVLQPTPAPILTPGQQAAADALNTIR